MYLYLQSTSPLSLDGRVSHELASADAPSFSSLSAFTLLCLARPPLQSDDYPWLMRNAPFPFSVPLFCFAGQRLRIRPMRRPYTTPCLAPYDVPAKERKRMFVLLLVQVCIWMDGASISARKQSSYPGRQCLKRRSKVCAVLEHWVSSMHACTRDRQSRIWMPASKSWFNLHAARTFARAVVVIPKRNVPCRLLLLYGEVTLVLVAVLGSASPKNISLVHLVVAICSPYRCLVGPLLDP